MSAMFDALRKAEAERKKAPGFKGKSPEGDNWENIKAVVLLIAVIIVFTIAFYRIKGLGEAPKKPVALRPPMASAAHHVPAPAAVVASKNVSLKVRRAPGTYGLDGVIDAGDNSIAIINGKLLKPEDTLDNLVLKKISPKEVELLNIKDKSTVILKID